MADYNENMADRFHAFIYKKMQAVLSGADMDVIADAMAAIRAEALEEAAKVCEGLEPPKGNTYTYGMYWEDGAGACADAIRALKEQRHE